MLDRHDNEPPFKQRHEARTFIFQNCTAYRFYRITFQNTQGDSQLQLAEIAVSGLRPAQPVPPITNYRRDLDLSTDVSTTLDTNLKRLP